MNRFRWLAVALGVSLLVNLVLVGFVAGRYSAGELRRTTFDPALGLRGPLGFLSEERRAELKPLLGQFRARGSSLRRLRGAQRTLYNTVTADPFERQALESALADFRENLLAGQEAGHAAFVDLVEALTLQERKRMLRRMRDRPRQPRREWSPPHR